MPLFSGSALALWALHQRDFLFQQGPSGWFLIFGLLSIPICLSLIPNTLAGVLAGYFLGWWGLAGMIVSFCLACLMGYKLGKKVDSGLEEAIFNFWPETRKSIRILEKESVWVIMLFRLSPAPPFAIGTLLLSWFRIPLGIFMIGSFIGMLPRMAFVVWFGIRAGDIIQIIQNPGQSSEIQWLSLFLLVVVMVGVYALKIKMNKKSQVKL